MPRLFRSVFLLAATAGLVTLFSACDNPFQDEEEDTGTAPKVLDAGLFPPGEPTSARLTTMAIGDSVELYVLIEDPDLDANVTNLVERLPDGSEEQVQVTLDSQSAEQMLYSFGGPVTITGPAGGYQMELTPEDSNGNAGSAFRFSYTITN